MTFNLTIKVDKYSPTIKDECMDVLSKYLASRGGYFAVEYSTKEINIDCIGKA